MFNFCLFNSLINFYFASRNWQMLRRARLAQDTLNEKHIHTHLMLMPCRGGDESIRPESAALQNLRFIYTCFG
jgi:hypothetical protein